MKKELDYFTIEGEFGWNQDDFKDFWMRKGGCACVTLCDFCIYMKKHRGEKLLYPYDVNHLTKRDFIEFSGGVKPYLLLLHQNPRFKDYVWHWFILGGYEEREGGLFVKAITYGSYQWLSLEELWDTGHKKKGGMILFSRE